MILISWQFVCHTFPRNSSAHRDELTSHHHLKFSPETLNEFPFHKHFSLHRSTLLFISWAHLAIYNEVAVTRRSAVNDWIEVGWGCKTTAYNFNLVRLQWRLLALYRILLPVRILIHWGIGRFCFSFLASFCLILNVLWDDIVSYKWRKRWELDLLMLGVSRRWLDVYEYFRG